MIKKASEMLNGKKIVYIGCSPDDEEKSKVELHIGTHKQKEHIKILKNQMSKLFEKFSPEEMKKIQSLIDKIKSNLNTDELKTLTTEETELLNKMNKTTQTNEMIELQKDIFLKEIMLSNPVIDGVEWSESDFESLPGLYSDYILNELHDRSVEFNSLGIDLKKN